MGVRDVEYSRCLAERVRSGNDVLLVTISGFLSDNGGVCDWPVDDVESFKDVTWYDLRWPSCNLKDFLGKHVPVIGHKNKWDKVVGEAVTAGRYLEQFIRERSNPIILMAHSLGCRIAYEALYRLYHNRCRGRVHSCIFLGGAVGAEAAFWKEAISAVDTSVYVVQSSNDNILSGFYRSAQYFRSRPIGLSPLLQAGPGCRNVDATRLVGGHTQYKENLVGLMPLLRNFHVPRPKLDKGVDLATDTIRHNLDRDLEESILRYLHLEVGPRLNEYVDNHVKHLGNELLCAVPDSFVSLLKLCCKAKNSLLGTESDIRLLREKQLEKAFVDVAFRPDDFRKWVDNWYWNRLQSGYETVPGWTETLEAIRQHPVKLKDALVKGKTLDMLNVEHVDNVLTVVNRFGAGLPTVKTFCARYGIRIAESLYQSQQGLLGGAAARVLGPPAWVGSLGARVAVGMVGFIVVPLIGACIKRVRINSDKCREDILKSFPEMAHQIAQGKDQAEHKSMAEELAEGCATVSGIIKVVRQVV